MQEAVWEKRQSHGEMNHRKVNEKEEEETLNTVVWGTKGNHIGGVCGGLRQMELGLGSEMSQG